ncbi:hypothetical protein TNCV_382841, partial [Trichonephila clavipes]
MQEKDPYPTCSIMVWAGIMIIGRMRLPYLNPIENVLDALGRQVAGPETVLRQTRTPLIRALTEEWDKLPQQLLDNVVQ